ncbi:MAG: glycosyltransferase family 9 protein [Gammaproteobacteria bacterium]
MKSDPTRARRFLVIRLGAIGDCLRVLPAVARLRRERPDAEIGWAVEHWVLPALKGNPLVTRFHVLDRRELKGGMRRALAEVRRFTREVKQHDYEVLLEFHGRFKSGLLAWLSGIPVRIGYARGFESEGTFLFTNLRVTPADAWQSRIDRFLSLLGPLGVSTTYDPTAHGLHIADTDRRWADAAWEAAGKPKVAVFPSTSAHRVRERWPDDKWLELLKQLNADGISSMVLWGPAEKEFCAGLVAGAGAPCVLAPPTTLPQMLALIGKCRAYCGADTAAMHMAWMQGVPAAVIAGHKPARTIAPPPPARSRMLFAKEHYVEGLKPSAQDDRVVGAVTVEAVRKAVHDLLA